MVNKLWIISIFILIYIKSATANRRNPRFFREILGVPDQCSYSGYQLECRFSLLCWLGGGTTVGSCGRSMLWSCCAPRGGIGVRTDSFSHISVYVENPNHVNSIMTPEKIVPTRNEAECGRQRALLQKRIIGGNKAKFGELPWQAHVRIGGFQCGGVLLNRRFVATAAHCVHKARLNDIQIHLGEFDTKDTGTFREPLPSEVVGVVEKVIHPNFRYLSIQPDRFDIALLRLSRPIRYRDNIIPVCLPPQGKPYLGYMAVVAGWGKTDTSFGKTGTNILHKVPVPVISNEECLQWHQQKNIEVMLHEEMMCAGHADGKMDACLGDSGGPLVVKDNGRWTLIGITSAGFGCAVDRQPGIYHRVSSTAAWISHKIYGR